MFVSCLENEIAFHGGGRSALARSRMMLCAFATFVAARAGVEDAKSGLKAALADLKADNSRQMIYHVTHTLG